MDNLKIELVLHKLKSFISEIEKSDNVKIELTASYNPAIFNVSLKGVDLSMVDAINKSNLILSKRFGFTQNIIGFDFKSGKDNTTFKVVEFKPKNRKYPIIAKNLSNNKNYKFSSRYVLDQIGGIKQVNRIANLDNLLK